MTEALQKTYSVAFYLLIFLLPVNLGLHFITSWVYLDGVLIDYWIPTLYVQDILVIVAVVLSLCLKKVRPWWVLGVLVGLLCVNLLFSALTYPTLVYSLRFAVYGIFCLGLLNSKALLDVSTILKLLYVSTVLVCVLALAQFIHQGSVLPGYVFFGEQPYTLLTPGILKHHVFDSLVVPPYSLFRHPNALGGYLSVVLTLFAYYLSGWKKHFILLLGSSVVFLTFSYAAWVSLLFGLFYVSVKSSVLRTICVVCVFLVFIVGVFGYFDFGHAPAVVHRRFLLTQAAADRFLDSPLVGHGLNVSALLGKDLSYLSRELTFFQPVHNLPWLVLSEGGLVLFIPVLMVFGYALFSARSSSKALFAMLLQLVVLGSSDHYLLTLHQTLLLAMLTMTFSINYTFKHEI